MEFETSTLMMLFFIVFFAISFWKIYAFLPNEQLADDDTTKESQKELVNLMLRVIKESRGKLNSYELFEHIINHENFNKKHFWRFNQNRLNQLLASYYVQHPHTQSIEDIYKYISDKD